MKSPLPPFAKHLEQISSASGHGLDRVFTAFCRLAACALAHGTREAEYMDEIKRWKKDHHTTFSQALAALIVEMEAKPFTDILGPTYMDLGSLRSQQRSGEFFTPQTISELCARMVMGEPDDSSEPVRMMEPACGAGGMILSAGKIYAEKGRVSRLRVTAIDINPLCCDMTFINTTLWGIPCHILHGNALSGEYWHSYKNLHWILCREDAHVLSEASRQHEHRQGQSPLAEEVDWIKTALIEKGPPFGWRERSVAPQRAGHRKRH